MKFMSSGRQVLATVLALLILAGAAIVAAPTAEAVMTPTSGGAIKGYVLATSGNTQVYTNSACTEKRNEYISAGDECYIKKISIANSSFYVSYPTQSGRKERWVPNSAFTSMSSVTTGDPVTMTAQSKITTYKKNNTNATYGSISAGDKVYVLESNGGMTRVIYPVSGGYKIAWISSQYVSKSNSAPSTSASAIGYVTLSNVNNSLNVRASASTSSKVVGKLRHGTQVTILGKSGNWYQVSANGVTGYVYSSYITASQPSTGTTNSSASSTAEARVSERLNAMMAGNYGNGVYKLNTTYRGPYYNEQCKGFAKQVHKILFGYNIGSTKAKPNNHTISISSNTATVGSLSSLNTGNVKDLMLKGRAGDFIQVRRSHGGSHSMIFLSANNDGVTVYECNVDGRNGIQKKTYSWSTFVSKNSKVTLYTANNYWLH